MVEFNPIIGSTISELVCAVTVPHEPAACADEPGVRLGEGKDHLVPAGVGGRTVVGGGATPATTPPGRHPPLSATPRICIVGLLQRGPKKEKCVVPVTATGKFTCGMVAQEVW